MWGWDMQDWIRNSLVFGLAVLAIGCILSYTSGAGWDGVFFTVSIIAFFAVRYGFGYLIGNAAERRDCGNTGWRICSLLFGPLLVWIVYLIFVHWRKIRFEFETTEAIKQ
jgi:hypothetical protein